MRDRRPGIFGQIRAREGSLIDEQQADRYSFLLMKPTIAFTAAVALLLSGCASTRLESNVTTFHSFSAAGVLKGTMAIIPAKNIPDGLEFQSYAARINSLLALKGLSPASSANADFIGTFGYGIDSGRSELFSRPIFGQTGGGTTFTTGSVYSGGQSAGYSASSFTPATFGVTGTANETGVTYTRIAELTIKSRKTGQIIWQGRNRSSGSSGEIAQVLPTMIDALLKDFPGQSGKTRFILLPLPQN